MKKFKFLPGVIMLILCVGVLAVGAFSVAPSANSLGGFVTLNTFDIPVEVEVSIKNTASSDKVLEKQIIRSGKTFSFGGLDFELDDDIDDIEVSFTIKNLASYTTNQEMADNTIGAFFASSSTTIEDGTRAQMADVLIEDTIKEGETTLVSAQSSGYTAILPGEARTIKLIFSLESFNSFSKNFKYNIFLEPYVAETTEDGLVKLPVVQTSTASEVSTLSATPLTDDVELFTTITINTIEDKSSIVCVAMPSTVTSMEDGYYEYNEADDSDTLMSTFGEAFKLKRVSLSLSLKTIGDMAFYYCRSLTNIDLNNVQTIGEGAFSGCTGLTSIDLSKVQSIESYAFQSCTGLTSIDLSNEQTIGQSAFSGCTGLTSIDLSDVHNIENGGIFSGCKGLTSVKLGNLSVIPYNMFSECESLTDIDLSDVQTIGQSAFQSCKSLTNVDLSKVKTIRDSAFQYCTSLTNVDLRNVQTIGDFAFASCYEFTEINLSSVISISRGAFQYCEKLTSVNMGNVKEIDYIAFRKCIALRYIYIPESVITIVSSSANDSIFKQCDPSLKITCEVSSKPAGWGEYWDYYSENERLEVVWGVKQNAVMVQTPAQNVEIQMTVTGGNNEFVGEKTTITSAQNMKFGDIDFITDGLALADVEDIVVKLSIKNLATYSTNQEMYDNAIGVFFASEDANVTASALASDVKIEDTITSNLISVATAELTSYTAILPQETRELTIRFSCLEDFTSAIKYNVIYKLYIENYVAETTSDGLVKLPVIDNSSNLITVFSNEEFLTSTTASYIAMPSNYTSIQDAWLENCGAFSEASNLMAVTLSKNLNNLGSYAFKNCVKLKSIDLSGIPFIGMEAFAGCVALKNINFDGVNQIIFCAFIGCESLVSIDLKDVTSIEEAGFYGCTNLKNVNMPSVESICGNVFEGCTSLREIYIPESVTTIDAFGQAACAPFYGCSEDLIITVAVSSKPAGWDEYWNYYSDTEQLEVIWATIPNSIMVQAPAQNVEIQMTVTGGNNELVGEKVTVTSAQNFGFGDLDFITENLELDEIEDIVVTLSIKNLATYSTNQEMYDNAIGVFFASEGANVTASALASDVKIEDTITSNLISVATAELTSYTAILPQETREVSIRFSCLEDFTSAIKYNVIYKLYIENYVAETTADGLVKLPVLQTGTTELYTTVGVSDIADKSAIVYVAMPSTITTIADGASSSSAFGGATNLKAVNLSENLQTIGSFAFNNCSSLKRVDITSINSWLSINFNNSSSNPLYKGADLYVDGEKLVNLVVPDGTTEIKQYVFYNYTSLTNIDLPSSITSIGGYAFYQCTSLTSIDLSDCTDLQSIGDYAFYQCTSLESIDLSGCTSLQNIGMQSFLGCTSLTSIDLSGCTGLQSIGVYAFSSCTSLTSVTLNGKNLTIGSGAFDKTIVSEIIVKRGTTLASAFTLPSSVASGYTAGAWKVASIPTTEHVYNTSYYRTVTKN